MLFGVTRSPSIAYFDPTVVKGGILVDFISSCSSTDMPASYSLIVSEMRGPGRHLVPIFRQLLRPAVAISPPDCRNCLAIRLFNCGTPLAGNAQRVNRRRSNNEGQTSVGAAKYEGHRIHGKSRRSCEPYRPRALQERSAQSKFVAGLP